MEMSYLFMWGNAGIVLVMVRDLGGCSVRGKG